MKRFSQFSKEAAFVLAATLAIGGLVGCGGGTNSIAKTDAAVVTYYYLPL